MFSKIYIEDEIKSHPIVNSIICKLHLDYEIISNYQDYWGSKKKPYLEKREHLNLFLARKKGQLIKEAPDAYGLANELHYYYIHTYNCIYECQYCYLQGYFKTPDIVIFVNHEEIISEMQKIVDQNPGQTVWFHAGEFSDSLALSHLTQEFEPYFKFLEKNPHAKIEYRTKSVNIQEFKKRIPLPNVYISFTLAPRLMAKELDIKCPSTDARLHAISSLLDLGYNIGIHFDPIIYRETVVEEYRELLQQLFKHSLAKNICYFSLGVVRFTKEVYQEVQENYPNSKLLGDQFIKSFDQKVRYPKPLRLWLLKSIRQEILNFGIEESKIYLCMENE